MALFALFGGVQSTAATALADLPLEVWTDKRFVEVRVAVRYTTPCVCFVHTREADCVICFATRFDGGWGHLCVGAHWMLLVCVCVCACLLARFFSGC